jgi:hypothetical protein
MKALRVARSLLSDGGCTTPSGGVAGMVDYSRACGGEAGQVGAGQ